MERNSPKKAAPALTTKIVEVEPYKTRPKYQHIKNEVD